jgi:C_GCAxxG_C_C family probable redox protein
MLAVGEHTLGHVDDQILMLTTGFAGGVGNTRQDICGALSAGVMIIGALHGRAQATVDDRRCQLLAARYRERFVRAFGSTCCGELRQRHPSCAALVEQASRILLEVIEEDKKDSENCLRD